MPDSTEIRRREIARLDFESAFTMSGAQHAATYDVSQSQISQDRRTDVYADELSKCDGGRLNRVNTKSWVFIEAAIDMGIEYMTADKISLAPKGVLYRAMDCIRLALEHTGEIKPPGDESGSSLLDRLFMPASVLEKENAELKRRIASIEARLSRLNGIGEDVLRDIPTDSTTYTAPDESVWESRQAYEEHTGRKAPEATPDV